MPESPGIHVVIPVGPKERHRRWLREAIASLPPRPAPEFGRVTFPNEIEQLIVVCDGWREWQRVLPDDPDRPRLRVFTTMWPVGVGNAFNQGVGLVPDGDYALLLGSDDWLEPDAVAEAKASILATPAEERDRTWYVLPLQYHGGEQDGTTQAMPNAACVVSRRFWNWCGGFPPEATNWASDHILTSALLANGALRPRKVGDGRPLYHYRDHPETQTHIGTNHHLMPLLRQWYEQTWRPRE